jgi:LmbE family N-acetylglucosaminyl deacetylase
MSQLTRRQLVSLAGVGVARAASGTLRVVVAGGHPGDPEYGCGGVVAKYTKLGHSVTLLYLNRGEKGCPEPDPRLGSALRSAEADKACTILKARPAFAGQCDGNAIVDASHYTEFRTLLQAEKPDVVFTQWPVDNHRDHRAISVLVYDAWLSMKKSCALYYYEVSDGEDTVMFHPNEYVDISDVEPQKRAACYAHASQSPDRYYALQDQVAKFRGLESGYARAEAFARHPQSAAGRLP